MIPRPDPRGLVPDEVCLAHPVGHTSSLPSDGEEVAEGGGDAGGVEGEGLLQRRGEREGGHVGGGQPAHRGVEVEEGVLGHQGGHLRAGAEADVVLVGDEAVPGAGDRGEDGVDVEGGDGAQV